jgi:hypothetical protein
MMHLTIDDSSAPRITSNSNWKDVEAVITDIDGNTTSFVILENADSKNYLQCVGNRAGLSVEYRQYIESTFKHFRIGKGKGESPLLNEWFSLECKVGPIMILKAELLTKEDVIAIFQEYFQTQTIHSAFTKRNITKQFQ